MKKQYMDFAPRKGDSAKKSTVQNRGGGAGGVRVGTGGAARSGTGGAARSGAGAARVGAGGAARSGAGGARVGAGVKAVRPGAKVAPTAARVTRGSAKPARARRNYVSVGGAGGIAYIERDGNIVAVGSGARISRGVAKSTGAVSFATEKNVKLGAIEDLNTRFVKSDVPKRPLSQEPHFATKKTGVAAAKARKIGLRKRGEAVEKAVEKSATKPVENSGKNSDKSAYKMPKSPFINQHTVVKRPLSKNVYAEKIETPKEEPKGPVTIITKPEKQAHVGLIVTIILTIILGAAAGTIAFLLIPK